MSGIQQQKKPLNAGGIVLILLLCVISLLFITPILLVFLNSFKGKLYVINTPFAFPNAETFTGINNYVSGITATGFPSAFGWSLFITVFSVGIIVLFSAMTAWYITRCTSLFCKVLYFAFVFAMIVPFQMVMFPLTKVANLLHLDNPLGILVLYLGFGAAQSVFLFSGFVKSVPIAVEEAAVIDGCNPITAFFAVIFPMLSPIAITVAILNAMWIWNDFLLPNLIIGSEYRTIPVAVQYLRGGYGSIDWGYMMAMIVLAVIPIIIFYFVCQKHIIQGVTAGSVKG
ncbi:sugar permease [Treponema primitia ZAS-2]|uniref:sn-glycerol-3-phosphate transport system permease protein UgpE n=1 Tax=Treponema primitia (strain ATCC BAA-887 / DSM 12427 / ZAS-2) TaxID=545694 RepID=F5YLM4_TREPZ|nr:carbohydrate ABC transporter permease [Treponema primitia]AEF86108.1 sugar permease [Treponema primitia ZAS-2]